MTPDPFNDALPGFRGADTPPLDQRTQDALDNLRARTKAKEIFTAELAAKTPGEPFDIGTVREVLARPAKPQARIEGLLPWEASMCLIAQRKAGKTTTLLNLARVLITGEDFLGRFPVKPIDGTVGFLNYEVSGDQLARWADDVGVDPDRVVLVNLRGRRNPLGNPADQVQLAEHLRTRGVESLICDPFGRASAGANQNDAAEVSAWLAALDHFTRTQVGAKDLILAAHAGWDGERGRGSSALEDWPDSIVNLVRGKDEDEESRYLKAIGRDVEVEEDRLIFNPRTRHVTMSGDGSRRQVAADKKMIALVPEVLAAVREKPGITGAELYIALRDRDLTFQRGTDSKAAQNAIAKGWISARQDGRYRRYWPTQNLLGNMPGNVAGENNASRVSFPTFPKQENPVNTELPNVSQLFPGHPGDISHTPFIKGGGKCGAGESGAGDKHPPAIGPQLEEKVAALIPHVCTIVAKAPGIAGSEIGLSLRSQNVAFQKGLEIKAIAAAVARRDLRVERSGRTKRYFVVMAEAPEGESS